MTLFRYDALRVLATLAVVWLHVSMYAVLYNLPGTLEWWTGNVADSAVRWCVPVFVLISGALLLGPRDESPIDFYSKRLDRLLVPMLFWSALYTSLKLAAQITSPAEAALSLWHGRPHYHLWYLYMAFGLYLLTPPLRNFLGRTSARERALVTFAVLALSVIGSTAASRSTWEVPFFALFAPYVGYYLLGYHLSQAPLRLSAGFLWAILLVSIAATAVGAALLGLSTYAYVGLPVLIMSTAVYALGSALPISADGHPPLLVRGVAILAKASLGIYLVHPLILELLERAFGLAPWQRVPLLIIPTFTALVFAASAAVVLVLLRLPYLRRVVGGPA